MFHFCAELCRKSYFNPILNGFKDLGDLRYGVAERNGVKYIVFRGSANLHNWIRNFRALPTRSPLGYFAHRGFVSGFRRVAAEIDKIIGDSEVVFTGHSFGAAVALLFAEAYNFPVVTFGCPRVYLKGFNGPKTKHTRFVCDDDPVTWVPKFFYKHLIGPVMLRDRDGRHIDFEDHGIEVYQKRMGVAA